MQPIPQTPAIKAIMDRYEQQATELEATLLAVKGEEYCTRVRLLANIQSSLGSLTSFMCGEVPLDVRLVAVRSASINLSNLILHICGSDGAAADELYKNMENLTAARDKLQSEMQKEIQKLLSKDDPF